MAVGGNGGNVQKEKEWPRDSRFSPFFAVNLARTGSADLRFQDGPRMGETWWCGTVALRNCKVAQLLVGHTSWVRAAVLARWWPLIGL